MSRQFRAVKGPADAVQRFKAPLTRRTRDDAADVPTTARATFVGIVNEINDLGEKMTETVLSIKSCVFASNEHSALRAIVLQPHAIALRDGAQASTTGPWTS